MNVAPKAWGMPENEQGFVEARGSAPLEMGSVARLVAGGWLSTSCDHWLTPGKY